MAGGKYNATPRRYTMREVRWFVVRDGASEEPYVVNSPRRAAALLADIINRDDDDREHFWVVMLNAHNHYLQHHKVAMGGADGTIVEARSIFGPVFMSGARGFLVGHNHPSGESEPSEEDIALTKKLGECADLLGLRFLDHIIVGNGTGKWISLATRAQLEAKKAVERRP